MNPPRMEAAPSVGGEAPPLRVLEFQADDCLPPPGTVITRRYKGEVLQVWVRSDGFEYEEKVYGSFSVVAKALTGQHCNGFHFSRIGGHGGDV